MSISPTTRRIMRWQQAHAWVVDTVAAAAVCLLDVPLGIMQMYQGVTVAAPDWLWMTWSTWAAVGVALSLRRRWPVATWLAVTLAPVAHVAAVRLLYPLDIGDSFFVADSLSTLMLLGTPLALMTIADTYRMRYAWAACVASTAVTAALYTLNGFFAWQALVIYLLPYALINIIGALVGMLLRVHRAQLADMSARSARAALAAEQETRLAAANERSRIAREMHDIVAHSLAVMITMADGAAASVERNPAMAKQALEVLAETGRSALADTRRLVGVLRDDPGASSDPATRAPAGTGADPAARTRLASLPGSASEHVGQPTTRRAGVTTSSTPVVRELPVPEFAPPGTVAPSEPSAPIAALRQAATKESADTSTGEVPLAPAPETADLSALVDRFRAAGVPVDYQWEGPALPQDKALELTVYRIAQEALTNILRYASMTRRVAITVTRYTGTVVLVVDNDAAPQVKPVHGSGKGLIGMRERAAVYGGTVDAGPTPTGWQVRAVLRWDEDDQGASPWQLPR